MKLLTIGQFSKITGLTPKALRIYDEIGLLKPDFIDPVSNYRYYKLERIRNGKKIAILRSVEMSLEDIRRFVNANSIETRNLLIEHKNKLRKQIDSWQNLVNNLDSLLEEKVIMYEISIKETESKSYLYIRRNTSIKTISETMDNAFITIFGYIKSLGMKPVFPCFALYPDPGEFDADDFQVDSCVPIASEIPEKGDIKFTNLPKQRVAFTVHKGLYQGIPAAYEAVANWIG